LQCCARYQVIACLQCRKIIVCMWFFNCLELCRALSGKKVTSSWECIWLCFSFSLCFGGFLLFCRYYGHAICQYGTPIFYSIFELRHSLYNCFCRCMALRRHGPVSSLWAASQHRRVCCPHCNITIVDYYYLLSVLEAS